MGLPSLINIVGVGSTPGDSCRWLEGPSEECMKGTEKGILRRQRMSMKNSPIFKTFQVKRYMQTRRESFCGLNELLVCLSGY